MQAEKGTARHFDSSSVVWTVIENGKLANQVARLAAIVVKCRLGPKLRSFNTPPKKGFFPACYLSAGSLPIVNYYMSCTVKLNNQMTLNTRLTTFVSSLLEYREAGYGTV